MINNINTIRSMNQIHNLHMFKITIPVKIINIDLINSNTDIGHEIIPNLWLGGIDNLNTYLKTNTINFILNVAKEVNITNMIPNEKIDLIDYSDENIYEYFNYCADLIHLKLAQNYKVYVCCHHGVSRSASIVIAYIMKYHQDLLNNDIYNQDLLIDDNILYKKAFMLVKSIRNIISPNIGFVLSLWDFNKSLLK
jgi:tyrosine-protein phosphatase